MSFCHHYVTLIFKELAVSVKRAIGIVLAVGLAIVVIRGMVNAPSQSRPHVSDMERREMEVKRVATLESYTAADLASAYRENTYAADLTFKDKQFKVKGTVANINTDFRGKPYITMKGGANQFMEPQFALAKSDERFAAALKKGETITLACTGRGDVAKTPMSGECTFIWLD